MSLTDTRRWAADTRDRMPSPWPRILVLAADPALSVAIANEVGPGLHDIAELATVSAVGDAGALVDTHPRGVVPVILAGSPACTVDALVETLDAHPVLRRAALVLLTNQLTHRDAARAIDHDRLRAILTIPWEPGILAAQVRALTIRWLTRWGPSRPGTPAVSIAEGQGLESPESALLQLLEVDSRRVTAQLVDGIERVLGPRPRLWLPAGTRLVHEGTNVDAVMVILRGRVALDHASSAGELRLHHESTGSVVGLLSLAQQQRAFFTARATTTIEVVHLSFEQLDRALAGDPSLGAAMAAVSIRALAARLRRADQLQVEKTQLNRALEQERASLTSALHQLEQARLDLVEQARFATLGEMAAGIAHELNNPIAAMLRATSHLGEDLERVFASHPQGHLATETFAAERARAPRSTREERAIRQRLETALGDPTLAERAFQAGIEDVAQARTLSANPPSLELVEAVAGIGHALRNLELASQRVCELVQSLRAFARPKGEPVSGVDLHAGLEDALRLMAHRLRDLRVERHYGDLPRLRCHPSELEQLWANLLANARDALEPGGRIRVTTDRPDALHVRVRIEDDGRGIDPDILPRVFEPRFTTKQGTVRYGLGLGLAIARRIALAHGGTIELSSQPGCTLVTVILPVNGPTDDEEKRHIP